MKKKTVRLIGKSFVLAVVSAGLFTVPAFAQTFNSMPYQMTQIAYPENGENLLGSSYGQITGRHSITVRNNSGSDAIVKVEDSYSGETYRLIFFRKDHTYTIDQIRDGSFILKFVLGADYSPSKRMFLKTGSVMQFDTPRNFQMTTFREGNTITTRYSRLSVTLAPVVGGTAQTSKISLKDF